MNKSLFHIATLSLGLAVLAGCDIQGKLTVNESVTLLDKKGRPVQLVAGERYKSEIGKDDGKVKFDIIVNGKERELRLPLPPGTKLPKENGEILIPAVRSQQPIDFHGIVTTDRFAGRDQRGIENCSDAREPVEICTTTTVGSTTQRTCRIEVRQVPGIRDTVYHDVDTVTVVRARLLKPATQLPVAIFNGQRSSTERVYTWRGHCRSPNDPRRPDIRPW